MTKTKTSPHLPRTVSIASYAKLNLYLEVLRRRKDGFHALHTIFERISLADHIRLRARDDALITVSSDSTQIPHDRSNLAYRSAALLQRHCRVKAGVDIFIRKQIPVGSGMGGGSSNAAAVLAGLNRLWGLRLGRRQLASLAASIGSDVPFFIYDQPFAFGRDKGDRITPLVELKGLRMWHILVVPKLHVSTPLIYRTWDRFRARRMAATATRRLFGKNNYLTGLTRGKTGVKLILLTLKKRDLVSLTGALSNSLEPVTEALYPQVGMIKERLLGAGVQSILMSGSGPAVFGIVSSKKEAVSIQQQLVKEHRSWRVFVVRTV